MVSDYATWLGQTPSRWQKIRSWVSDTLIVPGVLLTVAGLVMAAIVVTGMRWQAAREREHAADKAQAFAAAPLQVRRLLDQIGLAPDKEIVCAWRADVSSVVVSTIDCAAAVQGRPVLFVCRETCTLVTGQ